MNNKKIRILRSTNSFLDSISRRKYFYIFTILTLVVTGCKSLSKVGNTNTQIEIALTKDDFEQLNGVYSNSFDTIIGTINHFPYDGLSDERRVTVLSQLFQNYPETAWRNKSGKMINPQEKWIKIGFNSKKQATISLYQNDKFVFSKNIHGKFKNGYFYLRPKVYVIPLIPILFGYNFERTRIGKTTDDDLIIDYTVNRWGFALVAGSADKGASSTIYKKKQLIEEGQPLTVNAKLRNKNTVKANEKD
jgi:hypothetical protein